MELNMSQVQDEKKPNGAMEYSENYVIFDANKVKIIRKDNIN